jgi:hypothetical protein
MVPVRREGNHNPRGSADTKASGRIVIVGSYCIDFWTDKGCSGVGEGWGNNRYDR